MSDFSDGQRGLNRERRVADTDYGKGLFTNVKISPDVPITLYEFQVLEDDSDDLKLHPMYDYFFKSPEGNLNIVFGEAIFLNHSDEPNCRLVWLNSGTVVLSSLRRIEAGEELTIYYGNADEYGDSLEPNL